MARVDQQSVCDRELFSELTESPIARQSKYDRELFSELTGSPIARQSKCDREFSSELTEPPIVQQSVSDRELFSELAEPPIAEQTVCDRELFSELFETPIHPMLLNMVPPYVNVVIPTFGLQINGEGVWIWREVSGRPETLFELLQISESQLGYRLAESGCERVGQALAQSVRRFRLKIQSTSNGKKRKQLKGETWIKASPQPHEIEQSPNDVVAHLTRENRELDTSLEAKAADLYRHMCDTNSGKDFTEVGKRQRQRHLTQIQ